PQPISRRIPPCAVHRSSPCAFTSPGTTAASTYTLSLHDALPIYLAEVHTKLVRRGVPAEEAWEDATSLIAETVPFTAEQARIAGDRKSTRLNSSHGSTSYAVFCLKKKEEGQCRLLVQHQHIGRGL